MSKDGTYNGWANRATWNTILWLTNDEALYNLAGGLLRGVSNIDSATTQRVLDTAYPSGRTPDGDAVSDADIGEVRNALRELFGA